MTGRVFKRSPLEGVLLITSPESPGKRAIFQMANTSIYSSTDVRHPENEPLYVLLQRDLIARRSPGVRIKNGKVLI